jgi:preprotein translocase subunit YajC
MQPLVIRLASVGLLAGAVTVSFAAQGAPEAEPATAPAQTSGTTGGAGNGAGGPAGKGEFNPMIIMVIGVALLFLFMSRTNKKEQRKRDELLGAMKAGHKVVTIGGLHGEIAAIGETTVDVRVGEPGTVLTFNKTAIATNVTTTAAAAAAAAPTK